MKDLNEIRFDLSNTYKTLPKVFYTNAKKSKFPNPQLLILNHELAEELGINIRQINEDIIAEWFSGNVFPNGASPISQAYAGHQFGYFTVLGDGRAMLIGEITKPNKEMVDIQLKGSGRTVYSRGGDGRATLSPMLREYLISEAMHALKIPTTRSLAVVKTGEEVYRNSIQEGAVLTRIAKSHIRVGTFQFASMDEGEQVKELADYTINRHYKDVKNYKALLEEVVEKQAMLIAKWQSVGFIHGVMNTDNMSIAGETIDYGPCAFMDEYNPKTVFSSIDINGRYRYENQPPMAQWNLARFAESILHLIDADKDRAINIATDIITGFIYRFEIFWEEEMRKKLGFFSRDENTKEIIKNLLKIMQDKNSDFTNTFVRLTMDMNEEDGTYLYGTQKLFESEEFGRWKDIWKDKLKNQSNSKGEIYQIMKSSNPFIIPRNFMVEEVLRQAENGDLQGFKEFLSALKKPYNYDISHRKYQELPKNPIRDYKTYCGT